MYDKENWRYIGKDRIIEFTYRENEVLSYLIENKNRVVKYDELMKLSNKRITYSAIIRIINRLKKKLGEELQIKTKTGLGYYI